jgi:guanosine-3',5'-bis(diphosphate) 3'-pyrophosphohydrolase
MERIKTSEEIISVMHSRDTKDVALVEHAYAFSERAHHGQKRYSGDPYFIHVAAVGYTLAEMGMDATTISAGLLHDTVEDAKVSEEDIEREFGKEIRFLVDGVTKLGKLKYHGVERHVESLRKLFVSTAKDLRVIIIKLADRLHNVSTLRHVPKEKQKRIALETLEIYAPIANRLSIGKVKGMLEDYAFPFAYPEEYEKLQELLRDNRNKDNEKRLEKTYRNIQVELVKAGILNVHGEYRIKRMYSLYKKLVEHDMDLGKIYDLSAIRVIVPTLADCYRALGIVHSVFRPLPGRIKDYIAFPKPNGYKSLHTTIFTGDGGIVEVQFRTEEMNQEAAFGIAAHFSYKEGLAGDTNKKLSGKLDWVRQISQLQQTTSASGEYLENLKVDFFGDRVFVFTPKGDVVDLPQNSSPIDFAYAIHSDIGDHTSGAIVNGKFVALDTPLRNGNIVEIITKKNAKPAPKWMEYAKTTFAKKCIRSYLQSSGK